MMTLLQKNEAFCLFLGILQIFVLAIGVCEGAANVINFLEQPTSVSAQLGQTISLTCTFDVPVTCLWKRGRSPKLDIEGRYRYIDGNDGKRADCSIEIENISQIDFAIWVCGSADIEQPQQQSKPIKISERVLVDVISDHNHTLIEQRGALHRILLQSNDEGVITCEISNHQADATKYLWEHRDANDEKWIEFHRGNQTKTSGMTGRCRCSAVVGGSRIYSTEYIVVPDHVDKSLCETTVTNGFTIFGWILGLVFVTPVIFALVYCFRNGIGRFLLGSSLSKDNLNFIDKNSSKQPIQLNNQNDNQPATDDAESNGPSTSVRGSHSIINMVDPDGRSSGFQQKTNEEEKAKLLPSPKNSANTFRLKNKSATTINWIIKDYASLKQAEERGARDCQWREFQINGNKLKMKVLLYLNGFYRGYGTHMSVFFEISPKNIFTRSDNMPIFHHKKTFMIMDQRNIPEDQKRHVYFDYEPTLKSSLTKIWMTERWGRYRLVPQKVIDQKDSVYLKDGAIKLKILIEPVDLLEDRIDCTDGLLIWRIENYSQRKKDEEDGLFVCLRSPDFCCHNYRCKAIFYLNGKGKDCDEDCSIYLGFLDGEDYYDDLKPFAHRTTFAILDQLNVSNGSHIPRTDNLNPKDVGNLEGDRRMTEFSIGCDRFAKFADIEKSPYLIKNELCIAVMVERLNGNADPEVALKERLALLSEPKKGIAYKYSSV